MEKKYLQDPSQIFQKIHEAIANSVYVFDLNEKVIVWLNKPGQTLAGYSTEEIRKMGPEYYARMMHPDDIPYLESIVAKGPQMREGEMILAEYRGRDRQGNYHWVHDR